MTKPGSLRELGEQIEALARRHPRYNQAAPCINQCVQHLYVLDAIRELRQQLADKDRGPV